MEGNEKMDRDLWMYFIPDSEKPFSRDKDANYQKRSNKAYEQRTLGPVPVEQVVAYANEFFEKVREEARRYLKWKVADVAGGPNGDVDASDTGAGNSNRSVSGGLCKDWPKEITLDGKKCSVAGSCLIARECEWEYDKNAWKGSYAKTPHDPKYDVIAKEFGLRRYEEIVWLKFAYDPSDDSGKRYVGVVADSPDVNFHYDNTSGRLVKDAGLVWDESLVCIFPLTEDLFVCRGRKEIETGLGNYLIKKGVPIIDYYSHNYH